MDSLREYGRRRSLFQGMAVGGITAGLLFGTLAEFQIYRLPNAHAETAEAYDTVSGTLGMVNVAEKKGTLTTDVGKEVAFQIVKPELFINLSVGQRITLKLDKQGRAVRVMDTAAPELPPPSVPK
jgi:hypothetical protein